jgi:hypothetical protein
MKNIFLFGFLLLATISFAQVRPDNFPLQTAPDSSNFEVYSQKNGITRRANLWALKKYFAPYIKATPIAYVPASTGNTLDLSTFALTGGDSLYYIDGAGRAALIYDPNTLQSLTLSNDTLYLSGGGGVYLGGGGAGITDGDKGDITVSGSGTVWDIDAGTVGSTEVTDNSLAAGDLLVDVISSVDGVANDGGNIDLVAGANVTITPNDGANTITIAATDTDTQLSEEQVEDFVGGMLTGNTETGITVTYEDTDGTIDFVATDPSLSNEGSLTVGAGTSTTSTISSNTSGSTAVTLEAGTNITLSETGNTITIASTAAGISDGDKGDITVSSSGTAWNIDAGVVGSTEVTDNSLAAGDLAVDVVSSLDGVANDGGNIDLVAGANVTITPNDGANTITIAATDTDTQLSEEQVEDFVGGMLTGNTETGITVTYEDTDGTIDFVATDPSLSNEGSLTVGAGTSTTSTISSNTSGSTAVTLEAGTNITLSETGNTITIAAAIGAAGSPVYGEAYNATSDALAITAGVPVISDGMVAGSTNGFSYSAGRLTYSGASAMFFVTYSAEIHSTATGSLTKVWIYKNGSSVADTYREEYAEAASEKENITTGGLISLDSLDYLEVFFDASENATITIESANISTIRVGNSSGGDGVSDGDKGDITVSGSGTVWDIDAGTVGSTEVTDNSLAAGDLLVDVVSSLDGVTNDGGNIDLVAGANVTITPNDGANTITIAATDTDTQLSEEQVEDFVGGMLTGNTETGITVTYEDTDGTIDFVATDPSLSNEGSLTVTAGSGTTSVISSNTSGSTDVTLSASTGLSISETGNTITLTNTGDTNAGDDLTTSTSFSGDVSGLYSNLQLGANVVGTAEVDGTLTAADLAVNVVSSVENVTNDGGNIDLAASGIVSITGDDGANTITIGVAKVKQIKGATIESPGSSENISLFYTDHAITITRVSDVVRGTTPSVTYNIRHATTRDSGSPNDVFGSNRTVTSTSGATTTTFSDATIPANSWVWLITSATSGTITDINITLQYEAD